MGTPHFSSWSRLEEGWWAHLSIEPPEVAYGQEHQGGQEEGKAQEHGQAPLQGELGVERVEVDWSRRTLVTVLAGL